LVVKISHTTSWGKFRATET